MNHQSLLWPLLYWRTPTPAGLSGNLIMHSWRKITNPRSTKIWIMWTDVLGLHSTTVLSAELPAHTVTINCTATLFRSTQSFSQCLTFSHEITNPVHQVHNMTPAKCFHSQENIHQVIYSIKQLILESKLFRKVRSTPRRVTHWIIDKRKVSWAGEQTSRWNN